MNAPNNQSPECARDQSFRRSWRHGLERLADIERADIIVGIPFVDERETIGPVIRAAAEGLRRHYPGRTKAIVCCGSPRDRDTLPSVEEAGRGLTDIPVVGFRFDHDGLNGRGWCVRAMMEIAARLRAHMLLLSADLKPAENGEEGEGFGPRWVRDLLDPILSQGMDLAIPHFVYHHCDYVVEAHFAFPLIASIFGTAIRHPISSDYGMSCNLLRTCLREETPWTDAVGGYGFDPWLVTTAIARDLRICERRMGIKSHRPNFQKTRIVLRDVAGALFQQVKALQGVWVERGRIIRHVDTIGPRTERLPPPQGVRCTDVIHPFRLEFNRMHTSLLRELLPEDLCAKLERLAAMTEVETFSFTAADWGRALRTLLYEYAFGGHYGAEELLDSLFPIFLARLFSWMREMEDLEYALGNLRQAGSIVFREAEERIEFQAEELIRQRPDFVREWADGARRQRPYIPTLGAWEFVPRVGIVVPQALENPETGHTAWAREAYRSLLDRYRDEFSRFMHGRLGVTKTGDSGAVAEAAVAFMADVEKDMATLLFPGDLRTRAGAEDVFGRMFAELPEAEVFRLSDEAAGRFLRARPPRSLITALPCKDLPGLLDLYAPGDALALANWTEERGYIESCLDWIGAECVPADFETAKLKLVVVDRAEVSHLARARHAASLDRIAGRLILTNLVRGQGGRFARLCHFLALAKGLVASRTFGRIWAGLAEEEFDFGERLIATVRGHWGRALLGAHNAFENMQQREVAEALRSFGRSLVERAAREQNKDLAAAGERLAGVAESYHLCLTLGDGTFIPLSAWTWANYSAAGGRGAPTPLSVLVERDWATFDFVVEYIEAAGLGDRDSLRDDVIKLVADGRESEDLGKHLFGMKSRREEIVVAQVQRLGQEPAAKLVRPLDHPFIEPIAAHSWESRYVLNAAAVRCDGRIFIVYRAFGDDQVSRLGLAWSRDGCRLDGRLDEPIFEPAVPEESKGTEDPRITRIGDHFYMLYTAYDGRVAQIAMARIDLEDFLKHRWHRWERLGMALPGLDNKDAVICPGNFNGRYAVYHRIDPNMWITYLDRLHCPWPPMGHKIIGSPRPGMMWDSIKIGAGAPPLETEFGWLHIYHGVDWMRVYRLGVFLVDRDDPAEVIYQAPNPVLEPEADYELGETNADAWVPRVVFTCGAVPVEDRECLGADDEILVYYGAADSCIGVARGRIGDLIPESVRERTRRGAEPGSLAD